MLGIGIITSGLGFGGCGDGYVPVNRNQQNTRSHTGFSKAAQAQGIQRFGNSVGARKGLGPGHMGAFGMSMGILGAQMQKEDTKDAVREVQSERKGNNSGVQNSNVQGRQKSQYQTNIFTYNYWKDFDNNGYMNYPEEFVGIKNKFRKNEEIVITSRNNPFGKLRLEIYNPNREKVYSGEIKVHESTFVKVGDDWDLMRMLLKNGGIGTYKIALYLNDNELVGLHEFEITE